MRSPVAIGELKMRGRALGFADDGRRGQRTRILVGLPLDKVFAAGSAVRPQKAVDPRDGGRSGGSRVHGSLSEKASRCGAWRNFQASWADGIGRELRQFLRTASSAQTGVV